MTNNITAINTVITKAVEEAGIRDDECYKVDIISSENDLLEFDIETEWSVVNCYADLESTRILGIMATAKTIEEILWGPEASIRVSSFAKSNRAA